MPLHLFDRIPWATLRVRLTLWNTAAVFLMTLAALLAVRFGARAALIRQTDAVLRGEVNEVTMALRDLYPDRAAVVAELRRKAVGHEERGWFTQLLTDDGRTIWKSDHCPASVADWPVARDRTENLVQVGSYRFARRRITDPADEPFHVRIGMPMAFLDEDIDTLTRLMIPVGIGLSVLTPLVGYWLAVRATRPVARILSKAESLRPTRLGDRLEVSGSRDELDRLSLTINRLLDEVAIHVDRQQQFVADAAHELRGPLAAVQSTLEVALSHDRPAAEYRDSLAEVLDETRHLSKLANDLLLLAEAGDESRATGHEPFDLAPIVRQAVSMFAGAAEEKGVAVGLQAGGPSLVSGNASQLRQVASNLLDNAIRFTPAGGRVTVGVAEDRQTGDVVMTVADTGTGIAQEHIERVFDRFYKADASRSRDHKGRSGGLGLSICKSIVERHGGSIAAQSQPGQGTAITARLPQAHSHPPT
jgi:heavy metal sensor kinase